jgi:OmcA/MtrC family decaheme c-type cytochrome
VVQSVDAVPDTAITPNLRPQITFKLQRNGQDVVFGAFDAVTNPELITGANPAAPKFVGSPSVYFAFAAPQDGIAQPVDFNVNASGYVKNIWKGTASGTGAGTITGPDASGFYTVKLTGAQIPAGAVMFTGGVGYTYSLASAPPLVQTDVPNYPYCFAAPCPPANGYTLSPTEGGLIIPAPDVSKVGTGFTGRRTIVDNTTCDKCHAPLGVAPTFHAGQRNDGNTCAWCHNPNRTSSGWSANAKNFVHALHGARKRVNDFTWHATCPPAPAVCTTANALKGFWDVDFPPALNTCGSCHLPGMNTFESSVYTPNGELLVASSFIPRMLSAYVATGSFTQVGSLPSPYVDPTGATNYGAGFAFNVGTAATTPAAATNLYISPITSACSACHDTQIAIDHMQAMGGAFYQPRGAGVTIQPSGPVLGTVEQCLMCHGPGKIVAIKDVHK